MKRRNDREESKRSAEEEKNKNVLIELDAKRKNAKEEKSKSVSIELDAKKKNAEE